MFKKIVFLIGIIVLALAKSANAAASTHPISLYPQPGFFRFSFDNVKMPNHMEDMGLLGIQYYADITPNIYGGIGGYGSITGTQGGLFVLGFGGGYRHAILQHVWGDVGIFIGGGGGRASLVGGGFMMRPYVGIAYEFPWARIGVHYSYIDFTSGQIRSQQLGADLDIPFDFYYTDPTTSSLIEFDDIHLPFGKYLGWQRNDFALLMQAYRLKQGTRDLGGEIQDGTMGLIGAELDHYIAEKIFWYVKMAGAFHGIKNGYMDILGGLGGHFPIVRESLALVPQLGAGMGGGGNVNTGGGVLVQPQLGVELALSRKISARASGGYLWSPKGNLRATTATGMIIYHLDVATGVAQPVNDLVDQMKIQNWRVQLFNQTYFHPQRAFDPTITSPINLVAFQIDQLFTPWLFMCYQATSAYSGVHAGGYATGMIGPGVQTKEYYNSHWQAFAEILIGAGGGGGLALGGGAIIEPVLGIHYAFNKNLGAQLSVAQVKALKNDLNTTALNAGFTLRLATVDN